jgi:hypothetical protein
MSRKLTVFGRCTTTSAADASAQSSVRDGCFNPYFARAIDLTFVARCTVQGQHDGRKRIPKKVVPLG